MNIKTDLDSNKKDLNYVAKLLIQILNISAEVITLERFIYRYLNKLELSASENYIRSVKHSLNSLKRFFGSNKILNELSAENIEHFILDLRSKTPKGYRVYYRNLKAAFNFALENNLISTNPFLKIKLPKEQTDAPKFITVDELNTILTSVQPKELCEPIQFGFYTGCRLSEIVNLKWKDVDVQRELLNIGGSSMKTKSRKHRTIPIHNTLMKSIFCDHCAPEHFVFRKKDGANYTGDYISKRFKKAVRNAGLREEIHFHTLRHSFASNLAMKGVSILVIQKLLGHSSITTSEIYSHLNVEALSEAIQKVE